MVGAATPNDLISEFGIGAGSRIDKCRDRDSNRGHVEGFKWDVTAMSTVSRGKYGNRFNNSGVLPEKVMMRIVSFWCELSAS